MPPRPPALPTLLADAGVRLLSFAALAAVAALSLADLEPQHIYAWPWRLALYVALLAPFPALLLRTLAKAKPLRLPPRPWTLLALATAAVFSLSALFSPYREPSLLIAQFPLAAVAAFFLLHDWLARDRAGHRHQLLRVAGVFLFLLSLASLAGLGLQGLSVSAMRRLPALAAAANAHPLGSAAATLALSLVMLPCYGYLLGHSRLAGRIGWSIALALGLIVLFSNATGRVAALGLLAMGVVTLLLVRPRWTNLLLGGLALAAFVSALWAVSPRARVWFTSLRSPATPALDITSREAMRPVGIEMGRDRPLLGWGPGATPLVLPRYRTVLESSPSDSLQLHNFPLQLWAELGAPGLLLTAAFLTLVIRSLLRRILSPATITAAVALTGIGVVACYDSALDRPLPLFVLATVAALLAVERVDLRPLPGARRLVLAFAAVGLLAFPLLGRNAAGPRLIVRALALASDPAQHESATALLREAVAYDPNQPLARFNLGWLLVDHDPTAAETEFLAAARLAPAERGIGFGLALARLHQLKRDAAVAALVAECLNDPRFLASPRWHEAPLAELRPAVFAAARRTLAELRPQLAGSPAAAREADYLVAFLAWLDDPNQLGRVLAASLTPDRVRYFAARPSPPDLAAGTIYSSHHAHAGYLAALRKPDWITPVDVYEIKDSRAATELSFLFPSPGWLPVKIFLELLDQGSS